MENKERYRIRKYETNDNLKWEIEKTCRAPDGWKEMVTVNAFETREEARIWLRQHKKDIKAAIEWRKNHPSINKV